MQREPVTKRAVAFIDASNMRGGARRAFGESFSNFNPVAMAEEVCAAQGWSLAGVSYYLGVPDVRVTEDGHYTWMKRCARWRKQGVRVFTRTLLQDDQGTAREKGIDVRLALDAVGLYRQGAYDVAVIFSQDQDFSELAAELKAIAREQKRWVQVVSAFPAAAPDPSAATGAPPGGISGTIAIPLAEDEFRKMLDTPENRKRIHTPIAPSEIFRTPPAGVSLVPASVQPVGSSAAAAQPPASPPVPVRTRSRRPARTRWAATASVLYLLFAAATFLYLAWAERASLAEPAQALPALADHTAKALTWPVYWLASDEVDSLKTRLPDLQAFLQ